MPSKMNDHISLYARVSSKKQAKDMTIASQVQALKEQASQEGFSIQKDYIFIDEGYSGSTLMRPALERLRDAASNGLIRKIYIHSPDRLARNYAHQYLLIEELRRKGAEICFLNNPHGDNPESNLLLQVQGMISEYERAKIMERNRRGKLHAARQGKVSVLSGAPYGYKYINRHIDTKGGYIVNAQEAKVIRQAFEWVGLEGVSLNEASKRLTDLGVPTPAGVNTNWNRASLMRMLKNPAYKGHAAFGKLKSTPKRPRVHLIRGENNPGKSNYSLMPQSEDNWIYISVPPIVSPELFDLVQEKIRENKQRKRERKSGVFFLLRGLVVCGKCKYSCTGSSNGQSKYGYYVCTGTRNYAHRKAYCNNKSLNSRELEDVVWEEVERVLKSPRLVKQEYQRRIEKLQEDGELTEEKKKLKSQKNSLEKSISRLIDSYSEGLIEKHEFEPRIRHLKEALQKNIQEERSLEVHEDQKKYLSIVIRRLDDFADMVRSGLKNATEEKKREIILAVIKRVEIGENDVNIVFRVDQMRESDHKNVEHCCRSFES